MLSLLAVISFKAKVHSCSKSLKRERRDPSIRAWSSESPLPRPGKFGRMRMCIADDCLRKSLEKNFFGSFPQEIARKKTFSAKSLRKSNATSEKEGIEDGPQENGIFFGLLRDIVEILFACYRNGSIFAAVSWHM